MATEILVRVYTDGTGDYTSLRAAVIAEATNLVTADSYMVFELKGDLRNTDAFVDFNPYTTDATRNVIIRPIDADRTDGIAGNTGTIYGVSTFAIVSRNKFITIDGLDFNGWSSDFFQPANTKITNSLLSNGGVRILNVASLDNTIIYDVPNQTVNSIAGDVSRVTIVNKLSFYSASDFLFRSIAGALTFCVAYNEKSGSLNYTLSTNGANDFNASNDGTAPGANPQTLSTTDFTDYANNNFNIDPASPLFALGVGADLVPASGGISLTGTTPSSSYNAISSNINLTGEVVVSGTTTSHSYSAVNSSILLTPSVDIIGSTTSYSYASVGGNIDLSGLISVIGASTNYSYSASPASIILQGSISFTGSSTNYAYNALNGTIILKGPVVLNPRNLIRVSRKNNTVRVKRNNNTVRVR